MISTEGLDEEEMIKKTNEAVERFRDALEKAEEDSEQYLSDDEKAFN